MSGQVFSKTSRAGVSVSYQSEFMQNFVAESKINYAAGIKSIRFENDKTAIFYIDNVGTLTCLIAESGSNAGWLSVVLSPSGYRVSSFDLYYLENSDEFRLCYARLKDNRSELLVTGSVEIKAKDLANLKEVLQFQQVDITDRDREIDHITCDKRGVLFSSKKKGNDALYHYYRYDQRLERYTLPENTERVKQIEVGSSYGAYGVFILYDMMGSHRTMLFQSFPDDEYGELNQERIEVKIKGKTIPIECFDLVKNEEDNDIIYLAGEGIYRADATDEPIEIVAPQDLFFTRISAARHEVEETIWALRPQDQALYYVTNVRSNASNGGGAELKWTTPLPMYKGIQDFSCIKGTQFVNQLFLCSNAGANAQTGFIHIWQDIVSKSWSEAVLSVEDLKDMREVNSYTIDVNLTNYGSVAIMDPVLISCKENFYVYINNRKYLLSPSYPIELPFSSYYSIIYPTDTIAVPEISFTAKFLDEPLYIDPTAPLKRDISERIKTGSDLANAKRKNGQPLLSGRFDDKTLNAVADALQKATNIPAGNVNNREALRGDQQPIALLSDTSNEAVLKQVPESGNAVADLLYSIRKGFDDVTGFAINAVESAWKFVLEIGGKIVEWVVNTAKDVMTFLEQVWAKVKVLFKDIVEFLSFLLDWDDIIETKEALKLTANKVIDKIDPVLRTGQAFVISQIKELKRRAYRLLGVAEEQTFNQNFADLMAKDGMISEKKPDTRVNWLASKQDLIFGVKSQEMNKITSDQIMNIPGSSEPTLNKIINALSDFINGKSDLGQFIKQIAKILIDVSFDYIEQFANEIFEIVIGAVHLFRDFLNSVIEVPLLSSIYKSVSKSDLSLLDFICLVIAIPMTIAYKLVHKIAPFSLFPKEEFADRLSASLV